MRSVKRIRVRRLLVALVMVAAMASIAPAAANADKTFQTSQTFTLNNLARNTVFVSAYGNYSSTWTGYQKMAVSQYYASVYTYSGAKASRSRVTPEIKISGISMTISASGGSFSVASDTCVAPPIYSPVGSDYAHYYHDGVACNGGSVDLYQIYATNRAAVEYFGGWYGYTVTATYY
jgi:hypothetical protein